MSCRLIQSPITGTEIESRTWETIKTHLNGNEEMADKLYKETLSPEFTAFFGPWTKGSDRVSKAITETGEPRLMFQSFNNDIGNNFTTESNEDSGEAVFLSVPDLLDNIVTLDKNKDMIMPKEVYDELKGLSKLDEGTTEIILGLLDNDTLSIDQVRDIFSKDTTLQKELGNVSGFSYTTSSEEGISTHYLVFDKNNVRSLESPSEDGTFYNLDYLKSNQNFESIPAAALASLTKMGIVSKFNPKSEVVNEDRWYVTQKENSEQFLHEYMVWNSLNPEMFTTDTSQKGFLYVKPNKNFDLKDSIKENDEKIHKDKLDSLVNFFVNKLGIDKDKINYITKTEFKTQFPDIYKENAQSVYSNSKFYFFTNNVTSDITVEELLHPFIYTVKTLNPELFNNLLKEAKKDFPLLHQKIQTLYKSQVQSVRDQELVTQAMSRVFNDVHENEEARSFRDVISEFVSWISGHLNDLLKYFGTSKVIHLSVEDLHPDTKMQQIANLLNAHDTKFDVVFPKGTFYNQAQTTKSFNDTVTELLSNKKVNVVVDGLLAKLPDSLKEIKNLLNSPINKKERDALSQVVKQMEELENSEDKKDLLRSQVKGIITTIQIFNTLEDELNSVHNSDMDDNLKLSYYMSIQKTANGLGNFKELMLDLNNELKTNLRMNDVADENIKRFQLLLNKSLNAYDTISHSINRLVVAPVLEELVKSNEHSYTEPLNMVNAEIKSLEDKIQATNSQVEKANLQTKLGIQISKKNDILAFAPTRENLQKIFDGKFKDANQISTFLEAKIANGNPLINTLQAIINDIYDRAGGEMVNSKNEAASESEIFSKSTGRNLRDMEKRFEGVADDIVKIPTRVKFKENSDTELDLDKDGKIQFEYVNQNALIQEVDNDYITQYKELELIKDYYVSLHSSNLNNNLDSTDSLEKSKEAIDNFKQFQKKNSEQEYSKEYYDFRALLDTEIGGVKIRKITGDIYETIDDLQDQAEKIDDSEKRLAIFEEIKIEKIKLKKLKSEFKDNGDKKEGDELEIANILNKYSKLRYEFGDDVLTADSQQKYDFDIDALKKKEDQYKPEDFKRLTSKLQQTTVSQDYFEAFGNLIENINEVSNSLSDIAKDSPIAPYLSQEDLKTKKKDIYKTIRDITKAYRDDLQVINGSLLSTQNPDLVKRVKALQEEIEEIKLSTTKMTSLSPEESNELSDLYKIDDRSQEDEKRFEELNTKREDINRFKEENEALIAELNNLFKELGELSDTTTTDYYEEKLSTRVKSIANEDRIIDIAKEYINENSDIPLEKGLHYIKEGNRWYSKSGLGGIKKLTPVDVSDVQASITDYLAKIEVKKSDWYKDNHFTQHNFNSFTKRYEPTQRPIYIWEQQTPTNPNFIEVKPAREYYKYQVNKDNTNKNYKKIYKNIPQPLKGKFINKRFATSQADPAISRFLGYLTKKYNEVQSIYPENLKMGHVLPAIVKTEGENMVNTTNKVLSFDGSFSEMFKVSTGETDSDTSYLIGGSQQKSNAVPTRFVGRMDTKQQTKNALGAILMFEYHASLYKSLNEKLPLFEAAQLLANEVNVLEPKSYITKLDFVGKVRNIFSKKETKEEQTQVKDIEKSNLAKGVDSILNVFVYGQRMKGQVVDLGTVGKVDLAKMSNNILGFTAKWLFAGNIISAAYNSLGTRIQQVINSGIKSNLYTLQNSINAQRLVVKYGKDHLSDWTKLGNKSLIGQVIEHFQMLAENPGREITHKSEFYASKNIGSILSSPKQLSEFEVLFLQFMTMADATIVKKAGKDIKLSSIEDIFEIKDGKFQMKDDITFTPKQEQVFRGKVQSMARKIAGSYRGTELSQAETHWIGKSAFFLKRYFVSMARNRFAGKSWNSQEMEVQIGYQKETFNNLVKLFTEFKGNALKQWDTLSDEQKVAAYKTAMEYGSLFLMIALLSVMGGDDDKKELEKNSWAYNMSLVTIYRAKTELEQFTLKGVDDLIRNGKNPFMVFNTLANVTKAIGLIPGTLFGSEDAYYQQNSGLHEKGDSKFVATSLKLFGYTGATFNPESYLINFRNMQKR